MTTHRTTGGRGNRCALTVAVSVIAAALGGCSILRLPQQAARHDRSLAPAGAVGYVVCTNDVTPVELTTHTAEAEIPLPISGSPVLGDFAITTSADGLWAYVVTSNGVPASASATATTQVPATTGTTGQSTSTSTSSSAPNGVENVVIPIDLETQQALRPIPIPGQGGTHAIVVVDGGREVLASSGGTIVPIDVRSRHVGKPLDVISGETIFGMAVQPSGKTLYALVAGGVLPVDLANLAVGTEIPTGLAVSSVYSPHGLAVSSDGSTLYVVGQGGTDFGGRVLALATATGASEGIVSFDKFGIADPSALAALADGGSLLVVDSANNWINPVPLGGLADPPAPVRLPEQPTTATSGTAHPTDIVVGPGRSGAFVVDGFNEVIPYAPASDKFGSPITTCSGASSMAVAPEP